MTATILTLNDAGQSPARVGLVDYRAGNLLSIENAFSHLGAMVTRITKPEDFDRVSHVVLPGVGAFGHCRQNLDASGLKPRLENWATLQARPTLGICVGMQMMADAGLEHGRTQGLGWFRGEISALTATPPYIRVPHVGWNEITLDQDLPGLAAGGRMDVYFDHSYALCDPDPIDVAAWCDHGARFAAALRRGNLMATQFHPEKSQRAGLKLLSAFLKLNLP